ncbi:MAG TPA: hypothetical protein DEA63_01020 [Firmicutes bacterium]|nr:hypothetical protein [Bacillota bacterium]
MIAAFSVQALFLRLGEAAEAFEIAFPSLFCAYIASERSLSRCIRRVLFWLGDHNAFRISPIGLLLRHRPMILLGRVGAIANGTWRKGSAADFFASFKQNNNNGVFFILKHVF